jgi:hypothetical protein
MRSTTDGRGRVFIIRFLERDMIYNFVAEESNNEDTTPCAVGGTSYRGFEYHEKWQKPGFLEPMKRE